METALMETVVRLKDMVNNDVSLKNDVNQILNRERFFHEFVSIFSEEQMRLLHKTI